MIFNIRHAIAKEARGYSVTLHHGMSYERGIYSEPTTHNLITQGREFHSRSLSQVDKERLDIKLDELRGILKSAKS